VFAITFFTCPYGMDSLLPRSSEEETFFTVVKLTKGCFTVESLSSPPPFPVAAAPLDIGGDGGPGASLNQCRRGTTGFLGAQGGVGHHTCPQSPSKMSSASSVPSSSRRCGSSGLHTCPQSPSKMSSATSVPSVRITLKKEEGQIKPAVFNQSILEASDCIGHSFLSP
jgi:hypothetical protein